MYAFLHVYHNSICVRRCNKKEQSNVVLHLILMPIFSCNLYEVFPDVFLEQEFIYSAYFYVKRCIF